MLGNCFAGFSFGSDGIKQEQNRQLRAQAIPFISQLRESKGDAKTECLTEIFNLSIKTENQVALAADDLGLLPLLVSILHEFKGNVRTKACAILWNLAAASENKVIMASQSLGLVEALIIVISQDDNSQAKVKACGTLRNLAIAPENRIILASPELGLLPALVKVLRDDNGVARIKACGAVRNIAAASENKAYMGSTDLGLIHILVTILRDEAGEVRVHACGALANLVMDPQNIGPVCDAGAVAMAVDILGKTDYEERLWAKEDTNDTIHHKALNLLLHLAEWEQCYTFLIAQGVITSLTPLLDVPCGASIKVAMIITLILGGGTGIVNGTNSAASAASLRGTSAVDWQRLEDILLLLLENSLHNDPTYGYVYSLRIPLRFLRLLSHSDERLDQLLSFLTPESSSSPATPSSSGTDATSTPTKTRTALRASPTGSPIAPLSIASLTKGTDKRVTSTTTTATVATPAYLSTLVRARAKSKPAASLYKSLYISLLATLIREFLTPGDNSVKMLPYVDMAVENLLVVSFSLERHQPSRSDTASAVQGSRAVATALSSSQPHTVTNPGSSSRVGSTDTGSGSGGDSAMNNIMDVLRLEEMLAALAVAGRRMGLSEAVEKVTAMTVANLRNAREGVNTYFLSAYADVFAFVYRLPF